MRINPERARQQETRRIARQEVRTVAVETRGPVNKSSGINVGSIDASGEWQAAHLTSYTPIGTGWIPAGSQ